MSLGVGVADADPEADGAPLVGFTFLLALPLADGPDLAASVPRTVGPPEVARLLVAEDGRGAVDRDRVGVDEDAEPAPPPDPDVGPDVGCGALLVGCGAGLGAGETGSGPGFTRDPLPWNRQPMKPPAGTLREPIPTLA